MPGCESSISSDIGFRMPRGTMSGSMDRMGRFERSLEESARFVESLGDDTSFMVYGVSRTVAKFADAPRSGAAAKAEAATWIRELLTARWFDMKQALHAAAIAFDHPATGIRLEFTAPLPADMTALLNALTELR